MTAGGLILSRLLLSSVFYNLRTCSPGCGLLSDWKRLYLTIIALKKKVVSISTFQNILQ